MKYHVAHIDLHFDQPWQTDVFLQSLFDAGFDTFDGRDAYIPSELLEANKAAIDALFAAEPKAHLTGIEPCPDENWNATWEAEHPVQELPLDIRIIPHCAFGAGYHETTSMMIEALMHSDLHGKRVLDHGTGTGVLAVFAKRLGAANVLALDIDDKSVTNARENALLNHEEIEVEQCKSVLETDRIFDLIVANIHRNVLLANMSAYAGCLAPGGELWVSGFYEDDIQALTDAAGTYHLHALQTLSNGDWRFLKLG